MNVNLLISYMGSIQEDWHEVKQFHFLRNSSTICGTVPQFVEQRPKKCGTAPHKVEQVPEQVSVQQIVDQKAKLNIFLNF